MAKKLSNDLSNTNPKLQLEAHVNSALVCHNKSIESAGESAAHLYIVHRGSQSGNAKDWLAGVITAATNIIEEYNKGFKKELERAKAYKDGKLPDNDNIFRTPKDAADEQKLLTEKLALDNLNRLTDSEKKLRRKMPVTSRSDASKFGPLVKVALKFDSPSQYSLVSRYCKVLERIEQEFKDKASYTVQEITKWLETQGGFYAVADTSIEKVKVGNNETIIANKAKELVKQAVKKLCARAVVSMPAQVPTNEFTLLLARINGPALEIIGESGLSDHDIERAVQNIGQDTTIPTLPEADFLWRLIRVASFVPDGPVVTSEEARRGKKSVQRMITMRRDQDGKIEFVLSARGVEAGTVFHARPTNSNELFLHLPVDAAVLRVEYRNTLEHEITDTGRRAFTKITPVIAPPNAAGGRAQSPMSWKLENTALTGAAQAAAVKTVFWTELGRVDKVIDVGIDD